MLPKQPRDLGGDEARRFSDWDKETVTPEERAQAHRDLAVFKQLKIKE